MASTTSGTTSFTLDVDDLIEQALEPSGGEHTSGVEASKARRVLNLLLIQMQNENIPLHKINFVPLTLVSGTNNYTLPANIVDVLECNVKKGSEYEIPLKRWGMERYQRIPNKTMLERPTLFTTDRQRDAVVLRLWPTPNDTTFTATLLATQKIEDITASYQKIDIPTRYYPLLVKWLAYELSLNRQGVTEDIRNRLKSELVEVKPSSYDEDSERVDLIIKPGGISGR